MLKRIPGILGPDLLKILKEMGHGDEMVLADRNFPAAAIARDTVSGQQIRLDGHGIPAVLEAILMLFPLDQYVDHPVCLMSVVTGDPVKTPVWERYRSIITNSGETFGEFEWLERFAFYERAKKAYAVIATSESARYANIILKKGCVLDS